MRLPRRKSARCNLVQVVYTRTDGSLLNTLATSITVSSTTRRSVTSESVWTSAPPPSAVVGIPGRSRLATEAASPLRALTRFVSGAERRLPAELPFSRGSRGFPGRLVRSFVSSRRLRDWRNKESRCVPLGLLAGPTRESPADDGTGWRGRGTVALATARSPCPRYRSSHRPNSERARTSRQVRI